MSWRRITMKFPGTCIVCNEKIMANETGLWAKDVGVKHEKCTEPAELACMVCGRQAGCPQCEFRDDCNPEAVSAVCICKACSDKDDAISLYRDAAGKKFRLLGA